MRLQREVTGRPEIANQCIEARKIRIMREDTRKFIEKRIFAVVREKPRGHG